MSIFVDEEDMVTLTGFKVARKQIQQLKIMGVPFRVSASGRPVVAISAIEGSRQPAPPRQKVVPDAFRR